MRKTNWNDIAQLIGITAIVASLIFVGLEMRQSRDIALGEGALANAANLIEVNSELSAHAQVWIKGRAGGDLDEVERLIFRNLVLNEDYQKFFQWQTVSRLGYDDAADAIVLNMSRFLLDNPGARQVWTDHEMEQQRDYKLVLNREVSFGWIDAVQSSLEVLEGSPK